METRHSRPGKTHTANLGHSWWKPGRFVPMGLARAAEWTALPEQPPPLGVSFRSPGTRQRVAFCSGNVSPRRMNVSPRNMEALKT
jgi:hypothetical protein